MTVIQARNKKRNRVESTKYINSTRWGGLYWVLLENTLFDAVSVPLMRFLFVFISPFISISFVRFILTSFMSQGVSYVKTSGITQL